MSDIAAPGPVDPGVPISDAQISPTVHGPPLVAGVPISDASIREAIEQKVLDDIRHAAEHLSLAEARERTQQMQEQAAPLTEDWMDETGEITHEEQAILEAPPQPAGQTDLIEAISQRVAVIIAQNQPAQTDPQIGQWSPPAPPAATQHQVIAAMYGRCARIVGAVIAEMTEASDDLVAVVNELNEHNAPSNSPMHVAQHLSVVAHQLHSHAASLTQASLQQQP